MVHGQGLTEQEDRWRAIADELASVLQYLTYAPLRDAYTHPEAEDALRRYEEARNA